MPRLIDADALIPKGTKVTDDVIAVHNAIKNAPTIEAEPVRYGRWENYSTTMQECSVCKRHTPRHRYTFCPHCGAKMRGDTDE